LNYILLEDFDIVEFHDYSWYTAEIHFEILLE
jgi:hypothetical protein